MGGVIIKRTKSYKKIFLVILFLAIGSVLFLYSDKTAQGAGVTIGGDVYSGGDVNNVTVTGNSVVSSSGKITIGTNGNYQIQNYPRTIDLNQVNNIIPKLKTLNAQTIVGTTFSETNLNKNNFPEGTVWVANNGLTINSDVTFSGKGTIIVKGGDLKINANNIKCDPVSINNSKTSVGFIVVGDITIAPNVQNLCGAYFATGKITIN